MKQILSTFAVVLAFGLFAAIGSAQQQGSKGAVVKPGAPYHSDIIYAGRYKSYLLFNKGSGSEYWQRLRRFDNLRYVKCPNALQHLKQEGTWKGYFSFKDGSCVAGSETGEWGLEKPAEWALGNRLNYNEQVLQQQSNDKE